MGLFDVFKKNEAPKKVDDLKKESQKRDDRDWEEWKKNEAKHLSELEKIPVGGMSSYKKTPVKESPSEDILKNLLEESKDDTDPLYPIKR